MVSNCILHPFSFWAARIGNCLCFVHLCESLSSRRRFPGYDERKRRKKQLGFLIFLVTSSFVFLCLVRFSQLFPFSSMFSWFSFIHFPSFIVLFLDFFSSFIYLASFDFIYCFFFSFFSVSSYIVFHFHSSFYISLGLLPYSFTHPSFSASLLLFIILVPSFILILPFGLLPCQSSVIFA